MVDCAFGMYDLLQEVIYVWMNIEVYVRASVFLAFFVNAAYRINRQIIDLSKLYRLRLSFVALRQPFYALKRC
jgi:hypothetical protein